MKFITRNGVKQHIPLDFLSFLPISDCSVEYRCVLTYSCFLFHAVNLLFSVSLLLGTIQDPSPQAIADGFLPVLTNEMHFPMKIRMILLFARYKHFINKYSLYPNDGKIGAISGDFVESREALHNFCSLFFN